MGILTALCQNILHHVSSKLHTGRFRWSWGSWTCSQFPRVFVQPHGCEHLSDLYYSAHGLPRRWLNMD